MCKETLSVVGVTSIGGISGNVISWIGKAFDAELIIPIGLTIMGKTIEPGKSTTLRTLAASGLIQMFEE